MKSNRLHKRMRTRQRNKAILYLEKDLLSNAEFNDFKRILAEETRKLDFDIAEKLEELRELIDTRRVFELGIAEFGKKQVES